MKLSFLFLLLVSFGRLQAQHSTYQDSMQHYIANYVQQHEVVRKENKKHLHFYPVNSKYRIWASFQKTDSSQWFAMATSGKVKQMYKVYGTLSFVLDGKLCRLNLYQSQNLMQKPEYKDYLFLPFTDATNGKETYEGGRYLDLNINDINKNQVQLDFNKAYNPYCAYVSNVYNCPVPPAANNLAIALKAGEMKYTEAH